MASTSASRAISKAPSSRPRACPRARRRRSWRACATRSRRSVFTTPYANPVNGNPTAVRDNLREADRLLKEAGWEIKGGKRVNAKGEQLTRRVPRLRPDQRELRAVLQAGAGAAGHRRRPARRSTPRNTKTGCATSISTSSPSCGRNRSRPATSSANSGARQAADRPGSRNTLGIKDPGIDALIDRVIFAKDRDELVAATKALDRVLLAHDYVVPQWTYPYTRTARWNRFGRPATDAAIFRAGLPHHLVVGRRAGGEDGIAASERTAVRAAPALLGGPSAMLGGAEASPDCHAAGRQVPGVARATGLSHLRRAEIPGGFTAFRLCEPGGAQGRRRGPAVSSAHSATRPSTPSTRSTSTCSRATARRAWT